MRPSSQRNPIVNTGRPSFLTQTTVARNSTGILDLSRLQSAVVNLHTTSGENDSKQKHRERLSFAEKLFLAGLLTSTAAAYRVLYELDKPSKPSNKAVKADSLSDSNPSEATEKSAIFKNMLPLIAAASVSGLPADVISFPFSRMKTVTMVQGATKVFMEPLRGIRQASSFIYSTQGLTGFYRGLSPVLVTAIPGTTLFFMGMQVTKDTLGNNVVGNALSGLAGQVCGSAVWVPSEVFKELRQMPVTKRELQGKGVLSLMRYVLKEEGIRGMYRGFIPQLLTFGPFNSIGMSLSATLKSSLPEENQDKLLYAFFCNCVGFGAAAAITTPCDVVKTRIQVGVSNPTLFPNRSIIGCVGQIITQEGILALFAGTADRVRWLATRQGIAMTTFGMAYKKFSELTSEQNDHNESTARSVSPK